MVSRHDVLGTAVTMPVVIRDARCFMAAYTADVTAMRAAITSTATSAPRTPTPQSSAPSRHGTAQISSPAINPVEIRRGRGIVILVFVDYRDGDLGPYNEFGVCFLLAPDDPDLPTRAPKRATAARRWRSLLAGDTRALIHRLPVDGEFTLAAGRTIWGFPKTLADFDVDHDHRTRHGRVSEDGALIADLTVRPGIPARTTSLETTLHAYARLDGVTRVTPWRLHKASGSRTRLGGARLELGDHPIGQELRSLQLGKHALLTSSVDHLSMSFDDARPLTDVAAR